MRRNDMTVQRPTYPLRLLAAFAIVAMLAASCSSSDDDSAGETDKSSTSSASDNGSAETGGEGGLSIGSGTPDESDEVSRVVQVVEGEELSPGDIDTVTDRVGPLPQPEEGDGFERPPESKPPPRTGTDIDEPFPPAPQPPPPPVDEGPLEVLRYQPEGDVPIAPFVSITFNQAMVPLSTLGQVAEADVQATIEPAVGGTWQWIGTNTLRFDHDSDLIDRLPMATDYTVTVPAGTTSESGGALADDVSFSFRTPPAQVQSVSPVHDSLPLEPLFVATFDQHVDPDAVLAATTLDADGDIELRLATDEEIEADENAANRIATAPEGRWVAFRPVDALEPDTSLTLTIGPDIGSAEGTKLNRESHTEQMSTYAPLAVDDHACKEEPCDPRWDELWLTFNNSLDADVFEQSMVSVEPEIPGVRIDQHGNQVSIRGRLTASTTYSVSLSSEITDTFGQTLGDQDPVSFEVGPARPEIGQFFNQITTSDPLVDDPSVSIGTIGHDELRVTIYEVDIDDWNQYRIYQQIFDDPDVDRPDWPVLSNDVVSTADPSILTETAIAVGEALAAANGHVVVQVESTEPYSRNDDDYWMNRPAFTWVQGSTVGVDAFVDRDELRVWATDLTDGSSLDGVSVTIGDTDSTATTDAEGLASLPIDTDIDASHLIARVGDQTAIATAFVSGYDPQDTARWYVFDDRATYRPGETARVKGWVRKLTPDDPQLALVDSELEDGDKVTYTARDSWGNEIATGNTPLSPLGGFDFSIDIEPGATLGEAYIEMLAPDVGGWTHVFQIQEFRRPEFEVTTEPDTAGPYLVEVPVTVEANATYFAGGPLPDAEVEWAVSTRRSTYRPPNNDEYTFGIDPPYWEYGPGPAYRGDVFYEAEYDYTSEIGPYEEPVEPEYFSGRTDESGSHYLDITVDAHEELQPQTVDAEATVFDVNRQAWSSTSDLLVHPSDYYVGLRSDQNFLEQGDDIVVDGLVVDIDGEVVEGADVVIEAGRVESRFVDGEFTDEIVDVQTCDLTSGAEAEQCTFSTDIGGNYRIDATVTDDDGRRQLSRLSVWVSGGDALPSRNVEHERVTLVPDAEEYEPGDVAEVFVQAPFADAEGLLTLVRGGFVSTERFSIDGTSTVLEIPIEDRYIPNLGVQVDLVGTAERAADDGSPLPDAPRRPAFATGLVDLPIPPIARTLNVDAEPANDTVAPGADTTLDVTVTGPGGNPVGGAEMSVVIVDEAVLSLSAYELADPNSVFYQPIIGEVAGYYARNLIQLTAPDPVDGEPSVPTTVAALADEEGEDGAAERLAAVSGDADSADFVSDDSGPAPAEQASARNAFGGESAQADGSEIDERLDFDALAVFEPTVTTDAAGKATIDVPLPDSLTRYRVMVVAVDGADRFGSGEANITAQLPLMARPSAPRFLNFGDAIELPVIVQNNTDAEVTADVVIEATNLLLPGATGKRVTVPANDRVEVRFDAATDDVGTATFRIAAVSGDSSDAVTTELPVYTPATAEAFATYGVVDDGAIFQSVVAPENVFGQFGGLEIDTSSTALQALTDAVLYLHDYPFESADAYASRILSVAALRDVLEAFSAEGLPEPAELNASVDADIAGLLRLQNEDGGFAGWQVGRRSDPYRSIQAVHALVEARLAGYGVADGGYDRGLDYIRNIESFYPPEMSEMTRHTLSAYALHVRDIAGDRDAAKADALYIEAGDDFGLDGLAWLWPIIDDTEAHAEIARRFANAAVETAGSATFSTDYGDDAYVLLYSDRRTDGIVLDALISEQPDSTLIPKVVTGLLGNQVEGRWNNVQENAFILLALNEYFNTFESVDPDFIARVWLGDTYAAEHAYRGRSTDRRHTLVPMQDVVNAGDNDVIVGKEGAGRLYYRLAMRYAPDDLDLDPLDRGFVVQRTYEALDDPDDVSRDEDGTWRVKAGARVRVNLTMVAESRRTNMALIDPLPAGLEPLNPDLAVTQSFPPEIPPEEEFHDDGFAPEPAIAEDAASFDIGYPWWGEWYEHENLRDDRVEAIATLLGAGTYEYRYVARATTPGTYVVPPTRAEEIYAPETFGRSGTDAVVVE